MADQLDDGDSSQQVLPEASIVTQPIYVLEKIKAANNGAKYKIPEAEMGVCLSVLSNDGGMFANGVSHSGDKDQTASSITQPAEPQEVCSGTQLIKLAEVVQVPSIREGMLTSVVYMSGD